MKMITKVKGGRIIEYDEERFDVEYVAHKNMLVLRRLEDNKVLEIFSDEIGFLIQAEKDEETHFILTDYSEVEENEKPKFKHYIAGKNELVLKNEFECDSIWLSELYIADNSFLVEDNSNGCFIYNLNEKSKKFKKVYNDDNVKKIIGENVLLVSEERKFIFDSSINDTITYGIDPKTFEIVTPIWSDLQQRYINIYTEQQLNEKRIIPNGASLSEMTISFEIDKYLNKLSYYFEKPKNVYLDFNSNKVNEEFVKTFKNNK